MARGARGPARPLAADRARPRAGGAGARGTARAPGPSAAARSTTSRRPAASPSRGTSRRRWSRGSRRAWSGLLGNLTPATAVAGYEQSRRYLAPKLVDLLHAQAQEDLKRITDQQLATTFAIHQAAVEPHGEAWRVSLRGTRQSWSREPVPRRGPHALHARGRADPRQRVEPVGPPGQRLPARAGPSGSRAAGGRERCRMSRSVLRVMHGDRTGLGASRDRRGRRPLDAPLAGQRPRRGQGGRRAPRERQSGARVSARPGSGKRASISSSVPITDRHDTSGASRPRHDSRSRGARRADRDPSRAPADDPGALPLGHPAGRHRVHEAAGLAGDRRPAPLPERARSRRLRRAVRDALDRRDARARRGAGGTGGARPRRACRVAGGRGRRPSGRDGRADAAPPDAGDDPRRAAPRGEPGTRGRPSWCTRTAPSA